MRTATFALLAVVGTTAVSAPVRAEDWPVRPPPPAVEPTAADAPRFTRDQLIELVGPVALYPDVVLAALLPATAFPLDVVAAARHVRENGGQAATMPDGAGWDVSVQSLLQYPDVLLWLDGNLGWLEQMGVAVAGQQPDVFDAIQEFRRRAQAAGNLKTDEHAQVLVEPAPQRPEVTVVVIQPVRPSIVWIPVYDPVLVCRPWIHYGYAPISWSFGFSFGVTGPWCWHDIDWFWWDVRWSRPSGYLRVYRDPCWWYGRHAYAYDYAPTYWHAHHHVRRHFTHGTRRFSWAPDGHVTSVRSTTRPTYDAEARTYDPETRSYVGGSVRHSGRVRPGTGDVVASRGDRRRDRTHADGRADRPIAVVPTPTPAPDVTAVPRTSPPTRRLRPDEDSFRRGAPRDLPRTSPTLPSTGAPPSALPRTSAPTLELPRGDDRFRERGRGRDRDRDGPERRRTLPPTVIQPSVPDVTPTPAPRANPYPRTLPVQPTPRPRANPTIPTPRVLPTPTPRSIPTPPSRPPVERFTPPQRGNDDGHRRGRDRRGEDVPAPPPKRGRR